MFSYNQTFYFPFIIIYSAVNSYIVNKTLKYMEVQPPGIEQHKTETKGLRKKRPEGLYHRQIPEVSTPGEPPSSREQEVGVVASLLLPHTPSRTLRPVHEVSGTALHMLGEVLWCLVQFAIAASTKECDPWVLPCVAISGGSIFVHYPTVQAERYLFLLILAIIDGHPRQAIGLVKLVNHILSFRLK